MVKAEISKGQSKVEIVGKEPIAIADEIRQLISEICNYDYGSEFPKNFGNNVVKSCFLDFDELVKGFLS